MTSELRVHYDGLPAIFQSISGEAGIIPQGSWATFIRLQGCNLKCKWCDTEHARDPNGSRVLMTTRGIADMCRTKNVLITGGEPLYQEIYLRHLCIVLCNEGHVVQIETNGSLRIPPWSEVYELENLNWVIDYKCPSSGMYHHMRPVQDIAMDVSMQPPGSVGIKFVVADELDMRCAIAVMRHLSHTFVGNFIISPLDADGSKIEEWANMIRQGPKPELLDKTVFSVQLHKIVGMA